jgi:hypothetical protein
MELAVIIPIYKRHDLTELCFEHLSNQQKKYGFSVFITGSEGEVSENLARKYGYEYLEVANNPVSEKFNAALSMAKGFDGVVVIGSDDFLSDDAFDIYYVQDISKPMIVGSSKINFYSTQYKELRELSHVNSITETIGAGRLYTKAMLERVNWRLWPRNQNNGLDTAATHKCVAAGGYEVVRDFFHVDVKHAQNITRHAVAKIGKKKTYPNYGYLVELN